MITTPRAHVISEDKAIQCIEDTFLRIPNVNIHLNRLSYHGLILPCPHCQLSVETLEDFKHYAIIRKDGFLYLVSQNHITHYRPHF